MQQYNVERMPGQTAAQRFEVEVMAT